MMMCLIFAPLAVGALTTGEAQLSHHLIFKSNTSETSSISSPLPGPKLLRNIGKFQHHLKVANNSNLGSSDCYCSGACTCSGADDFVNCMTNPPPYCVPEDATKACNDARSQCIGDLDITCTPTSTGCLFQCSSGGSSGGGSGGSSSCSDGDFSFFGVCLTHTMTMVGVLVVALSVALPCAFWRYKCLKSRRRTMNAALLGD